MHPEHAGAFSSTMPLYESTNPIRPNDHPMDVAFFHSKPVQAVNHHSF
jgi:hypothetical protein